MKEVRIDKATTVLIYSKEDIFEDILYHKKTMDLICNKVGQYPGDYLDKWLGLSDNILFLKYKKNIIGFSMLGRIGEEQNFYYFPATMILSEFQNKGYAKKLWVIALDSLISNNLKDLLSPVYVLFRTQNPKLYAILSKKIKVYPNLKGKKPKAYELRKILKSANLLWPGKKIDKKYMRIIDAYKETPDLVFNPDQISWSGDDKIDSFFKSKLNLLDRGLNAFLVVGKVKFGFIIKILGVRL